MTDHQRGCEGRICKAELEEQTMDDLIARLERIRDRYGMMCDDYDCITSAAAQIHTARESLTEVYLSGFNKGREYERKQITGTLGDSDGDDGA